MAQIGEAPASSFTVAGILHGHHQQCRAPAEYKNNGAPLTQAAYNPDVPHMTYPKEICELLMQNPDEVIWENASETTAPSPNGYDS